MTHIWPFKYFLIEKEENNPPLLCAPQWLLSNLNFVMCEECVSWSMNINFIKRHSLLSCLFHQIIIVRKPLQDICCWGQDSVQVLQRRSGRNLLASLLQSLQDSCCHFTAGLHQVLSDFLKRNISTCQGQGKHCIKLFHNVRTKLGRNKCGAELFVFWQHRVIYIQWSQIPK